MTSRSLQSARRRTSLIAGVVAAVAATGALAATPPPVLDARASFPEASLADLYDPLAMPPALRKAHHQLDKAVDAAYAYKGQPDDASRVAFLFGLYEQNVATLTKFKK